MSSSTRNMPSVNLGTLTVSGTNTISFYIPAAPGVKDGAYGSSLQAPGYGLSATVAALQLNITGPLAGTIYLDGSVDGINFSPITSELGITLPLITDAHKNVSLKTDGVLSLYTKVPVFTSLATTAVSSTVGQITFLDSSAQPHGVKPGDVVDITSGADSGSYTILSVSSNAPNGRGNTPTGGTNSTPITWTITFTTSVALTGSKAATALIYSGDKAGFSSATGSFITNNVVAGDVVSIVAASGLNMANSGRFLTVVSGISATAMTVGTPGGIIIAGTNQQYTVSTSAPYPNVYTMNLSNFGYPFLEMGVTASGLSGTVQGFAAAK